MQRSLHFSARAVASLLEPYGVVVRSLLRAVTATDFNLDVRYVELSVPCSLENDSGVRPLEHWLGLTALFPVW